MKCPDGFTTLTPFVSYDCASEAIDLYKQAFNAKEIQRIPLPDGGVSFALLEIGNARFMLGDIPPDCDIKSANTLGGSPISFYVYVDDIETAFEKAKNAGMSVLRPVEDQFWGDKMGALVDRFQIMWTLAQYVRDVSADELISGSQKMHDEALKKDK